MRAAQKISGFTLVETLVAVASLVIFFAAVSAMVDMSLKIMGRARVEALAASVGQSKVELANNLPYEDLGTLGGIPQGVLPAEEVDTSTNNEFIIKTNVVYIDDPFDGLAPDDLVPIDYKRVRVEVDWTGPFAPRNPLVFWNDVAPKGLEQLDDAGTISILVFDADGLPVSGAEVEIVADDLIPAVNISTTTDIDGRVFIPGASECVECYAIEVTKDGFTTDKTYGTDEVINPALPHLSVFEGQVTESTFTIDESSVLRIQAFRRSGTSYVLYDYIPFRVHGTKEIGRDAIDQPVYKFDQVVNTGATGEVIITDIEWDNYEIDLQQGALLEVIGSWGLLPISVQPGGNKTFQIVLGNNMPSSLRVAALANETTALENVQVRLQHLGLAIDQTRTVAGLGKPDQGQVYFPVVPPSLEPYQITLSLDGYLTSTASATVSGDSVEVFTLSQEE